MKERLPMSGEAGVATEVTRVIDACVLSPIEGLRAAGEDIRGLKLWVDLRTARPKAGDAGSDSGWQLANPVETDWTSYGEMVQQALCTRSKDLELGLFLTEAMTRVHGFAGARDGLWMISGLIEGFAGKGLFPQVEDGDLESQYGKLDWLNEKFSDVVREIPLTLRAAPLANYSLNYRDEARRQGGMITAAEFDAAASAGKTPAYEELLQQIAQAETELSRLKQVVTQHYGLGVLSFSQTEETLIECRVTVRSFLRKRQPDAGADHVRDADAGAAFETANEAAQPAIGSRDGAWAECERLARAGSIDRALSGMAALAAAEPNGRVRFQRKLLLADLCLQTNRRTLGASILQELNEIIEQHKLESWETSEVVGGVWARLIRCYRDIGAGTADEDREQEFYLKLSRLDPWQALACGEPARSR